MKEGKIKSKVRGAYLTSLVSISMVLLLLGIVGWMILGASFLSTYVKENICFSLIIKNDVREADIKQYQKTLDAKNFIKATEYITKEDAASSLQEELGEDFISTLGYNPLSATLNVYLTADYAHPDSIAKIENLFLTESDIVEELAYQHNLLGLINDNINKISLVLLVFSAALFVISLALINNTVRLMIFSKRFIINSMRLVGAKRSFIRKPFLISGALQGLFSSLIAIAVLSAIFYFVNKHIGEVVSLIDPLIIISLYAILIIIGILLTSISTYFSINKYLKLKTSNLYY
ncbi:MAG TPA: permease-like cell division protein FtsX [Bacteroidales bacterium]|nr:permease-like cell division protein FtsX [Bacteroidales bacterium]HOR60338.1 permease-like cell division protein FtsX [Bacteroidales bacterium]HPL04589.1 permease-like cell division protein FtsX [Bacteroidales bacterium]HPX76585.1 permease-like cell division protein FtsX [Bacteroidales bacterium]HQB22714.1 permease-like cell division protein FtsX [Bacteroidales bacterium]